MWNRPYSLVLGLTWVYVYMHSMGVCVHAYMCMSTCVLLYREYWSWEGDTEMMEESMKKC